MILCAGTGCMANGAMKVFERFRKEMDEAGLHVVLELRPEAGDRDVRLSKSGCQGFCQMGPLVSIVPDGILYTKVRAEDVPEIVERTLVSGEAVEARPARVAGMWVPRSRGYSRIHAARGLFGREEGIS